MAAADEQGETRTGPHCGDFAVVTTVIFCRERGKYRQQKICIASFSKKIVPSTTVVVRCKKCRVDVVLCGVFCVISVRTATGVRDDLWCSEGTRRRYCTGAVVRSVLQYLLAWTAAGRKEVACPDDWKAANKGAKDLFLTKKISQVLLRSFN